MDSYLFVYGTLKSICNNETAELLRRTSKLIDEATWNGKLYIIDYYPVAVTSNNVNDIVHGEVYLIKDFILPIFDEYEECSEKFKKPTLFNRIKTKVYLKNDGSLIEAEMYIYNLKVDNFTRINSGIFIPSAVKYYY